MIKVSDWLASREPADSDLYWSPLLLCAYKDLLTIEYCKWVE